MKAMLGLVLVVCSLAALGGISISEDALTTRTEHDATFVVRNDTGVPMLYSAWANTVPSAWKLEPGESKTITVVGVVVLSQPLDAEPQLGMTMAQRVDLDNDGDVDLQDFVVFQTCFNGPNKPPAC